MRPLFVELALRAGAAGSRASTGPAGHIPGQAVLSPGQGQHAAHTGGIIGRTLCPRPQEERGRLVTPAHHHDRQRPEGEVQNRRLPFPVIAVSCVSSDHLEAVSPRCDRRINFCKILIKVHAEEAVLRLPLVQAILFRIFCHAYYPLCRENKPRTRRTPGRGGFILLNSL